MLTIKIKDQEPVFETDFCLFAPILQDEESRFLGFVFTVDTPGNKDKTAVSQPTVRVE